MGVLPKLIIAGAIVMFIVMMFSAASARVRENKVRTVKPGMRKAEVEALLGAGGTNGSVATGHSNAFPGREELLYNGNPSLWYGRLDGDRVLVGYTNNIVSDIERGSF